MMPKFFDQPLGWMPRTEEDFTRLLALAYLLTHWDEIPEDIKNAEELADDLTGELRAAVDDRWDEWLKGVQGG